MTQVAEATIERLKGLAGVGFFEVYHTISFECYRNRKGGGVQQVTVEILDSGPAADQHSRYHCHARSEDGKTAAGNPGRSIEEVLAIVHWEDLDK